MEDRACRGALEVILVPYRARCQPGSKPVHGSHSEDMNRLTARQLRRLAVKQMVQGRSGGRVVACGPGWGRDDIMAFRPPYFHVRASGPVGHLSFAKSLYAAEKA